LQFCLLAFVNVVYFFEFALSFVKNKKKLAINN